MIKDGGLSFETQLKIEFLPLNNSGKRCLEKSLRDSFSAMSHMEVYPYIYFWWCGYF